MCDRLRGSKNFDPLPDVGNATVGSQKEVSERTETSYESSVRFLLKKEALNRKETKEWNTQHKWKQPEKAF